MSIYGKNVNRNQDNKDLQLNVYIIAIFLPKKILFKTSFNCCTKRTIFSTFTYSQRNIHLTFQASCVAQNLLEDNQK